MRDRRPLYGMTIEQQPQGVVCALALIGEAWGEQSVDGRLEAAAMAAVLWVGENRRADPRARWPKTLRQVFLQPKQFSCFNAGSPVRDKLLIAYRMDPISWERADSVCDLFELGILIDPTVGATHYCLARLWGRDDAQRPGGPSWHSQQEIAAGRTVKHVVIGGHVFGRAA